MANNKGRQLNYCEADYGQIFWDENKEIIMGVHENDGTLEPENLVALLGHYDIKVIKHRDVPAFVKEWEEYENYGEVETHSLEDEYPDYGDND